MSINSIYISVERFGDFDVHIDDAKLEYIKTAKASSLRHARPIDFSTEELQEIICGKLCSNYIFNTSDLAERNVTKLNIIIEVPDKMREPIRLMTAWEYRPDDRVLGLVTSTRIIAGVVLANAAIRSRAKMLSSSVGQVAASCYAFATPYLPLLSGPLVNRVCAPFVCRHSAPLRFVEAPRCGELPRG